MMRSRAMATVVVGVALLVALAGCRGGGQAGAAAAGGEGPAPTAVLTVDGQGKADYKTIQAAIEAAPDGAMIRVGAGVYRECLEVRKPLTIEGAGPDKTTIVSSTPWAGSMQEFRSRFNALQAQGGEEARKALEEMVHQYGRPALLVADTEGVALRGLKLTLLSPEGEGLSVADGCVMLEKAKVELSNCAVVGAWTYGVSVAEGSGLKLRDCLVAAVLNSGVRVKGREGMGPIELTGTDFRKCSMGVELLANCPVTIQDCRFLICDHAGVRYQEAAPSVIHCAFVQAHQGISGWSQGGSVIRDSVFCMSDTFAVNIGSTSAARIENNTFVSNAFSVVMLRRPFGSTIRANIFSDNGVAVLLPEAEKGESGAPVDASGATASSAGIGGNLFWRNSYNVGELHEDNEAHTQTTRSLPVPLGNETTNPLFRSSSDLDFGLQPDSPALVKKIGAQDPLPMASKWPVQSEEDRMPQAEDQPLGK